MARGATRAGQSARPTELKVEFTRSTSQQAAVGRSEKDEFEPRIGVDSGGWASANRRNFGGLNYLESVLIRPLGPRWDLLCSFLVSESCCGLSVIWEC
jgi:hypothetical protein